MSIGRRSGFILIAALAGALVSTSAAGGDKWKLSDRDRDKLHAQQHDLDLWQVQTLTNQRTGEVKQKERRDGPWVTVDYNSRISEKHAGAILGPARRQAHREGFAAGLERGRKLGRTETSRIHLSETAAKRGKDSYIRQSTFDKLGLRPDVIGTLPTGERYITMPPPNAKERERLRKALRPMGIRMTVRGDNASLSRPRRLGRRPKRPR